MRHRIGNKYFKDSLKMGQAAERDFAGLLKKDSKWSGVTIMEGMFPDYDITATKDATIVTWEIKYNSGVSSCQHVFVEVYQSGKPSGMQVTTADYQVHYADDGRIGYLPTMQLAKLIGDKNRKITDTQYTYDGVKVSAQGYTVRFSDLILLRG